MRMYSVIVLLLLLCLPATSAAGREYIVGVTTSPAGKTLPEAENVLRELYRRIGIDVKVAFLPTLRDLASANDMTTDASSARTLHAIAAYPNLMLVMDPLVMMPYNAYAMPNIRIAGLKDLEHFRIASVKGDLFARKLAEDASRDTILVKSVRNGIDMVLAGRADVLILDFFSTESHRSDLAQSNLLCSPPLITVKYYHAVNKVHAELVPKLEHSLRSMKQDGTWARLLGRYHVPDQPGSAN